MGGKVLVPTAQLVRTLTAARLAADVLGVPTVLVARTDATRRTPAHQRHRRARPRVPDRRAHRRGLLPRARRPRRRRSPAASPTRRTPTCSGSRPRRPTSTRRAEFARSDPRAVPRQAARLQLLAVVQLEAPPRRRRRSRASSASSAQLGYRFQFVTLAGFHALNHSMFELAHGYAREGMTAYVRLQEHEFALEPHGYTATRHQREVGTGYFDQVADRSSAAAQSSTTASPLDGASVRIVNCTQIRSDRRPRSMRSQAGRTAKRAPSRRREEPTMIVRRLPTPRR